MGCSSSGRGYFVNQAAKLPEALQSIATRFESVILHTHLDLDVGAAREFGNLVASKERAGSCADVIHFLQLLWNMFLSRPKDIRWLSAYDACVWMLSRPCSGCPEDILSHTIPGEVKTVLQKADTDLYGDSLRAMVFRWANDQAIVANDSDFKTLTKTKFGQHVQDAVLKELSANECHVDFVSQYDEVVGTDEAVIRTWWDDALSAQTTLDALVRVSAFHGSIAGVIRQQGRRLVHGKPRTAYLRSAVSSVLWSFGSDLLQQIGGSAAKALQDAAKGDDKNNPRTLDGDANNLVVVAVKGLKLWMQDEASDPVIVALISEVANAAKELDIPMATPRPSLAHRSLSESRSVQQDDDESSNEEMAALARNSERKSESAPKAAIDDASLELPCGFVFVEQVLLQALACCASNKAEIDWARGQEANMIALQRSVAAGGKVRSLVVDFLTESLDVRAPVFVTKAILDELRDVFQQCDKRADLSVGIEDLFGRCDGNRAIMEFFDASHGLNHFVGIFHRLVADGKQSIGWQGLKEQFTLHEDGAPAPFGPLVLPPHQLHVDTEALIAKGLAVRVWDEPREDELAEGEQEMSSAQALLAYEENPESEDAAYDEELDLRQDQFDPDHMDEEAPRHLQKRPLLKYSDDLLHEENEEDSGRGKPMESRGPTPGNTSHRSQADSDEHMRDFKRSNCLNDLSQFELKRSGCVNDLSQLEQKGCQPNEARGHTPGNTSHRSQADSEEQMRELRRSNCLNDLSSLETDVLQSVLVTQHRPDTINREDLMKSSGNLSGTVGGSYELSIGELPPSLETTMREPGFSSSAYTTQNSVLSAGEVLATSQSGVSLGEQRKLQTIAEVDVACNAMTPGRKMIITAETQKSPGRLPPATAGLVPGALTDHTPGESTIQQNMCSPNEFGDVPGSESFWRQVQMNGGSFLEAGFSARQLEKREVTFNNLEGVASAVRNLESYGGRKGQIAPEAGQHKKMTLVGRGPLPPLQEQAVHPLHAHAQSNFSEAPQGVYPVPQRVHPQQAHLQAHLSEVPPLPFAEPPTWGMSMPYPADMDAMRQYVHEIPMVAMDAFGAGAYGGPSSPIGSVSSGMHLLEDIGSLRHQIENLRTVLDNDALNSNGMAGVWFDYQSARQPEYVMGFGGARMTTPTINQLTMPGAAAIGSPVQSRASVWNTPMWGMPAEASFGFTAHPTPLPCQTPLRQAERNVCNARHYGEHMRPDANEKATAPTNGNERLQAEVAANVSYSEDEDEGGIKAHLRDITRELADCRRHLETQRLSTALLASELRASHAGQVQRQRMYLTDMPQLKNSSDSPKKPSPLLNLTYPAPLIPHSSATAGDVFFNQQPNYKSDSPRSSSQPPNLSYPAAPLMQHSSAATGDVDLRPEQLHLLRPPSLPYPVHLAQRKHTAGDIDLHQQQPKDAGSRIGWEPRPVLKQGADRHLPSFSLDRVPSIPSSMNRQLPPGKNLGSSQHGGFYSPMPTYSTHADNSRLAENQLTRSSSEPKMLDFLRQPGLRKLEALATPSAVSCHHMDNLKAEMQSMEKRLATLDGRFREMLH